MQKSESISTIAKSLLAAQKEMEVVLKDSTNPFFKSKYADLNSLLAVAKPSLHKYGIVVLQPIVEQDGHEYVQTTLLHESGEFLSDLKKVINVKPNDAQSNGAGCTYARRFGLQSFLSMEAIDDDAESITKRNIEEHKNLVTKVFISGQDQKFVIPIGKNKGKNLDQLQRKEIDNFINWAKEQKDLKGAALTTLKEMEQFIK